MSCTWEYSVNLIWYSIFDSSYNCKLQVPHPANGPKCNALAKSTDICTLKCGVSSAKTVACENTQQGWQSLRGLRSITTASKLAWPSLFMFSVDTWEMCVSTIAWDLILTQQGVFSLADFDSRQLATFLAKATQFLGKILFWAFIFGQEEVQTTDNCTFPERGDLACRDCSGHWNSEERACLPRLLIEGNKINRGTIS